MNLQEPRLGEYEIKIILDRIKEPVTALQSHTFLKMLEADQIEGLNKNPEGWLQQFSPLSTYRK